MAHGSRELGQGPVAADPPFPPPRGGPRPWPGCLGFIVGATCEQGFGPLLEQTIQIVLSLRQRLDKATWLRLLKNGRMLKELNEVLPVVSRFLAYLDDVEVAQDKGVTC